MSPKRRPLAEFLEEYRAVLSRVAAFARAAGAARADIQDDLESRPLSLPHSLRDRDGAADLAAAMRALAAAEDDVDAPQATIRAELVEVIREVFAPPAAGTEGFRGIPGRSRGGHRSKPPAMASQPGLLGADQQPALATAPQSAPKPRAGKPAPRDERWINAELEDQPSTLKVGKTYTLAFDVDVKQRQTAAAGTRLPDGLLFPEGVDEVELTVQLDSTDFTIRDRERPLFVPRTGKSEGKARFDITPLHDGPSNIKATFHKDGNFVQQMNITFDVGGASAKPVEFNATGRPPSAASVLRRRDLSIHISRAPADEYDCVVVGAVSGRARLRIQQAQLAAAIDAARDELMRVVMYEDASNDPVFQTRIDIPQVDSDKALEIMARAGARLFQNLFFGPAAGDDSKRIGEFIRQAATDATTRLKLQVVAESAPIPWGLLYVGTAASGSKLSWDDFLGMRHVIEQIPLQNTFSISDPAIPSDKPDLSVSINLNTGIDAQMGATFVADQRKYWNTTKSARPRLRVTARTRRDEVVKALASNRTADKILYFYCHAESEGLGAPGGPDKSCLVLTDDRLTLGDLNLDAPMSQQLKGHPLVFINACESAQLSPAFYDGFVPYFMAKGARGVIGTECKTPALFAVEWAKRFFDRFLDGAPLGDTFLALRREFLDEHRNPLGLLYAVHCDGDTQIDPSLALRPTP